MGTRSITSRRVEIEAQQRVESRQVELVDAHGRAPEDEPRRRPIAALEPEHETGLRSHQKLVAAEGHQIDPQAQRLARRGLLGQQRQVGQRAAAEIVDDQRVALVSEAPRAPRWSAGP